MDRFLDGLYIIYIIQTHLEAMASNLVAMAPNLEAMASNLVAMVSNLTAIASNLRAMFVRSSNGSKRTTSRTSRPSVAASRSLDCLFSCCFEYAKSKLYPAEAKPNQTEVWFCVMFCIVALMACLAFCCPRTDCVVVFGLMLHAC